MIFSTRTFTYHEKEDKQVYYGSKPITIHYCAYCGEKAQWKDVGSTRNHRYEEDVRYFCDCEQAKEEQTLKKQQMDLKNQLYRVEKSLEKQVNLPDSPAVERVKYACEWHALQRKYPNVLDKIDTITSPKK